MSLCALGAQAEGTFRVATYHTELSRKGPGLLLRDILKGDPQVQAVAEVIASVAPDILALQGFDHDIEGHALAAFVEALGSAGVDYPYLFSDPPNTGIQAGFDLDRDGRLGEPEDALSYGEFRGQGGVALLSRYPLGEAQVMTGALWADLPFAPLPQLNGDPYYTQAELEVLPLASTVLWDVPVVLPQATVRILAWHGQTPVFDGPEDRNGLRGAGEVAFWRAYLDQVAPSPFVVMGVSNIDPHDGDGRADVMQALLSDPRLQDVQPRSAGGVQAADPEHLGDPAHDTVDLRDGAPGNLRVDYVLPSADLNVRDARVVWPPQDDPFAQTVATASRHRLVWVDLSIGD